jgi:predicted RNA-binding protein with PIN domain
MRHYILDGHNILLKKNVLKSRVPGDPAQVFNQLILRCQRFVSGKSKKCTVFFDGAPPGDIIKGIKQVQVTFSYNQTADSMIKSLIERSKNPRNLIIVSDDTEIQRFARVYSCEIQSVKRFLTDILQPSGSDYPEKPTTDDLSIEEWLRLFNH